MPMFKNLHHFLYPELAEPAHGHPEGQSPVSLGKQTSEPARVRGLRWLLPLASVMVGVGCVEPLPDETNTPVTIPNVDDDEDGATTATDCNDSDPAVYPGAAELCDGVDQDCDQVADEDVVSTWYYDADGDGSGDPELSFSSCTAPIGYVATGGDCDDTNPAIFQNAPDICDGIDNDCDEAIDEDLFTYYQDTDQDEHGNPAVTSQFCSNEAAFEAGYAPVGDDCNDLNAIIYPGALELCDDLDNDCDSAIDEDNLQPFYPDGDGDGYGATGSTPVEDCRAPVGYADKAGDCNDTVPAINPGAKEVCNGIDDDCDSATDETGALGEVTFYRDEDGDGFGNDTQFFSSCDPTVPFGYSTKGGDCNDANASIHPGVPELCDGIDNNCDGNLSSQETLDSDNDGTINCIDPTVYAMNFDAGIGDWQIHDILYSSEWSVTNGCLFEDDGSAYSYAYGPELGSLTTWTLTVDTKTVSDRNDAVGFVFGMKSVNEFFAVVWKDPADDNNDYNPAGEVELYTCNYYCSKLASDNDSAPITMPRDTFTKITLSVAGQTVKFRVGNTEVFSYTDASNRIPPLLQAGLYSEDNDGGVCYDNFVVTNP